jgi:hypothetical protein
VHAVWDHTSKKPQQVAGWSDDAGYRSRVPGVLFQEGVRTGSDLIGPAGRPAWRLTERRQGAEVLRVSLLALLRCDRGWSSDPPSSSPTS